MNTTEQNPNRLLMVSDAHFDCYFDYAIGAKIPCKILLDPPFIGQLVYMIEYLSYEWRESGYNSDILDSIETGRKMTVKVHNLSNSEGPIVEIIFKTEK